MILQDTPPKFNSEFTPEKWWQRNYRSGLPIGKFGHFSGGYVVLLSFRRVHPRKLIWNLKMMVSNRNLPFQGLIFRFHVKLRGSKFSFHGQRWTEIFDHDRKVTEHDKLLDLEVKNSTLGDVSNENRAPSFGWLGDLLGMEILPDPWNIP